MRTVVKIGLGILIFLLALSALAQIDIPSKSPTKISPTPKNNITPPSSNLIHGTVGKEVRIKNLGITAFPPIYSKTFYLEYLSSLFSDRYRVYYSRDNYHFAMIKIKTTNYGKEEYSPLIFDIKLITEEDLRYMESSGFNTTKKFLSPPPTPLLKDYTAYPAILPRESREGYFFFEIPKKAKIKEVRFMYMIEDEINIEKEVTIKFRPASSSNKS